MTLDELLSTCASSEQADWNVITCWGAGMGPAYLDEFIPMESQGEYQLRHNAHSMRASYKPDISIGIGWGLSPGDAFPDSQDEPERKWSTSFPDTSVGISFLDLLYCGALVHRERFATVDGGRCYLPWPSHDLTVTQVSHDLIRMLDQLEKQSEFDRYFGQAKFKIG